VQIRLSILEQSVKSMQNEDETLYLSDYLPLLLRLPLEVRIITMNTLICFDRSIMTCLQTASSPGSSSFISAGVWKTCLAGAGTWRIVVLRLSSGLKPCSTVQSSSHVTGYALPILKGSWIVLGISGQEFLARNEPKYKWDPNATTLMTWQWYVLQLAME
jgi:hypothetical protein